MLLSEEQILTLAPDESSKKSGKELANPAKWVSKGVNELALWGECQGSGSKPYQTQIDIINTAFKCSCPSRKFPCKHGLGLLLLYARQQASFPQAAAPAWVTDWLSKRTDTQEKKAARADKPVDEAAQQKRLQARQQKVAEGLEELRRWIKDIVRNGILNMPEKGYGWFEQMAKRMVDAQAPGLANMISALGETNFYREGWQSDFMDQLVRIYLVIEGYSNITNIGESLQADIRSLIGFTQPIEEMKSQAGIEDTWIVLAKQITENDNITTERYWMYGQHTRRSAMVLQFIIRGQGGELVLTPGMILNAELVFFPSVAPLRAIIKKQAAPGVASSLPGLNNWMEVAEAETATAAVLPVRYERPYIVKNLTPILYNQQWWLQDDARHLMQLKNNTDSLWKLLSLSGGNGLDMVVIGKEDVYETVAVWYNQEYKII